MTNSKSALAILLLIIIGVALMQCGPGVPARCRVETVSFGGDSSNLLMDIYLPLRTPEKPRPAFIYFHGGSWISGSRTKILQRYRYHVLQALIDSGCVVASADYRLLGSQQHTMMQQIADCRSAISFFVADPVAAANSSNVVVWGSSAGAHLAMMAVLYLDSLPNRPRVSCMIDDFGPANLRMAFGMAPDFVRRKASPLFFGQEVATAADFDSIADIYSPANYGSRFLPTLIFHGTGDAVVDVEQSRSLCSMLGDSVARMVTFSNNGHGLRNLSQGQLHDYFYELWNFAVSHPDTLR